MKTTKSNYEALIEQVGGIEKAREIVEGAPEMAYEWRTNGFYYTKCGMYYCVKNKEFFKSWTENAFKTYVLNDLRAAIASHREFKVGDLVVLIGGRDISDNRIFTVSFTGWDSQISVLSEVKFKDIRGYNYPKNWFRHAEPPEIKEGHRIDSDDTTDIRNCMSPSCEVKNV